MIYRFDKKLNEFPYIQCRFWFHDVAPECKIYNYSQDKWIIDCLKEGYEIGLSDETNSELLRKIRKLKIQKLNET